MARINWRFNGDVSQRDADLTAVPRADEISVFPSVRSPAAATTTWQEAIAEIRSDKYKDEIEAIRAIKDDRVKCREAKKKLPAVTFGGTFNGNRSNNSILDTTGFIVADMDHLPDVKKTFSELTRDENVWLAFDSPSDGIKCGFRSETVSNDAEHKQLYATVEHYCKDVYDIEIDSSCKDISRLTFMSYDPDAYINEDACFFDHSEFEDLDIGPEPKTTNIESTPATPAKKKYGDKVLASACHAIRTSEPGNQHATRLKRARTVGGYIATGYIDRDQALSELERAVGDSGAEDLRSSMKDITDGINHGERAPLDPIAPEVEPATTSSYPYITFEDIYTEEIEEKPIARGFLYEGEGTLIHAKGGVGKSLITTDMSLYLASQRQFSGGLGGLLEPSIYGKFSVPQPRTTLFLQSENGRLALHKRLRKMCKGTPEYIQGLQNLFIPNIHNDVCLTGGAFADEKFYSWLIKLIQEIESKNEKKLDILNVDPLISFHDADENDNVRMRATLDILTGLSKEADITPIVVHHDNRHGKYRGASAIFDWARNMMHLTLDFIEEETEIEADGDGKTVATRSIPCIRFEHEKANNFKKFEPFRLRYDHNLRFREVIDGELTPPKTKKHCEEVVQALKDIGGQTTKRTELTKQYMDLTGVKSDRTAKNRINEAVDLNFITRELNNSGDKREPYIYKISEKSG